MNLNKTDIALPIQSLTMEGPDMQRCRIQAVILRCGCVASMIGKREFSTERCTEGHKLLTKQQASELEDHWIHIKAQDSTGAYLKRKFQVFRELFG